MEKNGNYARLNADSLVDLDSLTPKRYNACGKSEAKPRFSGRSLIVKGFELDSISELESPAVLGNIPAEWLVLGGLESSSTEIPDRFWRTLVADRGQGGQKAPLYYRRACQITFSQRMEGGDLDTHDAIYNAQSSLVSEYVERVQAVVWSRRMMITAAKRLLGLVPKKSREGDLLCILHGCSVPVILRKRREFVDGDLYELVGECFVYGIMDGEALTIAKNENILIREFELR